jgi:hypothetical protein
MSPKKPPDQEPVSEAALTEPFSYLRQALHGLRFGSITFVVQDGQVVQVERTEKQRFQNRKKS